MTEVTWLQSASALHLGHVGARVVHVGALRLPSRSSSAASGSAPSTRPPSAIVTAVSASPGRRGSFRLGSAWVDGDGHDGTSVHPGARAPPPEALVLVETVLAGSEATGVRAGTRSAEPRVIQRATGPAASTFCQPFRPPGGRTLDRGAGRVNGDRPDHQLRQAAAVAPAYGCRTSLYGRPPSRMKLRRSDVRPASPGRGGRAGQGVSRGGRIALIAWTPAGFVGQMFATMKPYAPPPPPGAQPPLLWGVPEHVSALLADRVSGFTPSGGRCGSTGSPNRPPWSTTTRRTTARRSRCTAPWPTIPSGLPHSTGT
jgi:hypothetical protein